MELLGMILAAALAAVIVAIIIVKYLPLKLRWLASVLLMVLAIFIGFKIYNGIMEPIKFNKNKIKKFTPVVNNLKIIRDAQVRYNEVYGKYTKDKNALVKFIDTAKLALTDTRTIVEKVNRGGGIIDEVEKRVTDTIGYEPVLKYFKNKDYQNMFKVPGTNKEFEIEIGTLEKVQGLIIPTFRARVDKKSLLEGENESLVKLELEAIATDQIKGEYISVGSLDEVSVGGNWPPLYDKKVENK